MDQRLAKPTPLRPKPSAPYRFLPGRRCGSSGTSDLSPTPVELEAIGLCLSSGRKALVTSEIETPRLLLRLLTEADEERFVKLFADPRVTRYITLTKDRMPKERAVSALRRNLDAWQKYGYGPLAPRADGVAPLRFRRRRPG
jgi:RimJ/RimL family protein N-acetyltransferase